MDMGLHKLLLLEGETLMDMGLHRLQLLEEEILTDMVPLKHHRL